MVQEITALRARGTAVETAQREQIVQLEEAQPRAAGATPLVDTRAFGKAAVFSGSRTEWSDWKFAFFAFMAGANPT